MYHRRSLDRKREGYSVSIVTRWWYCSGSRMKALRLEGAPREGRFGISRGFLLVTIAVTVSRRRHVIVVGKRCGCVRARSPGTCGHAGSDVEEYCDDTSKETG